MATWMSPLGKGDRSPLCLTKDFCYLAEYIPHPSKVRHRLRKIIKIFQYKWGCAKFRTYIILFL
ncbi:hypothetical protein EWP19_08685 [Acinetobacter piscicola]|nr:hypothetical protein EWP19_08685 [Acinetobacter piscicola]